MGRELGTRDPENIKITTFLCGIKLVESWKSGIITDSE